MATLYSQLTRLGMLRRRSINRKIRYSSPDSGAYHGIIGFPEAEEFSHMSDMFDNGPERFSMSVSTSTPLSPYSPAGTNGKQSKRYCWDITR